MVFTAAQPVQAVHLVRLVPNATVTAMGASWASISIGYSDGTLVTWYRASSGVVTAPVVVTLLRDTPGCAPIRAIRYVAARLCTNWRRALATDRAHVIDSP